MPDTHVFVPTQHKVICWFTDTKKLGNGSDWMKGSLFWGLVCGVCLGEATWLSGRQAPLFESFAHNGRSWGAGQWLGLSVCRGFYLDCSNLGEKLCDEWVLSALVCGTGSFSAHTATHSINESAHETQSFSPKSRNPNKPKTPSWIIPPVVLQ